MPRPLRDSDPLAEAKTRIEKAEEAIRRLDAQPDLSQDDKALRARFVRQLEESLRDYNRLVGGEPHKAAAGN
jgi:hypothetical protein